MSSITLKKIIEELAFLKEQVIRGEEIDLERLESLEINRDKKLESIAFVILSQKYLIAEADEEIKRLQNFKKSVETQKRRLENYTIYFMNREGTRHFKGKNIGLSIRKSPTSVEVPINPDTNEPHFDFIDERFITTTEKRKVEKAEALRHYKNTGEVPAGFTIIDDKENLQTK